LQLGQDWIFGVRKAAESLSIASASSDRVTSPLPGLVVCGQQYFELRRRAHLFWQAGTAHFGQAAQSSSLISRGFVGALLLT
jgi:hypothetical protein